VVVSTARGLALHAGMACPTRGATYLNAADPDVSAHRGDGCLCKLAGSIVESELGLRADYKMRNLFPAREYSPICVQFWQSGQAVAVVPNWIICVRDGRHGGRLRPAHFCQCGSLRS